MLRTHHKVAERAGLAARATALTGLRPPAARRTPCSTAPAISQSNHAGSHPAMAEGAGFEPAIRREADTRFPSVRIQPLCHPSQWPTRKLPFQPDRAQGPISNDKERFGAGIIRASSIPCSSVAPATRYQTTWIAVLVGRAADAPAAATHPESGSAQVAGHPAPRPG